MSSPWVQRSLTNTVSAAPLRQGEPTVCRRALIDRDCPFTHDWVPAGETDVPMTRSPHDVRTESEKQESH